MKKRILTIIAALSLVVVSVFAIAACSANSSAESVAKAYTKASVNFDAKGVIKCMYFENDKDAEAAEKLLDATYTLAKLSMDNAFDDWSISLSSIKYTKKSDLSDTEITAKKALYGDANVEAGEKGTVSATAKLSYTSADGTKKNEEETEEMGFTILKIDGKWYIDYFAAIT